MNFLKKISLKKSLILVVAYILLLMFLFFPIQYEIYLPGGINEASRIIEIENSKPQSGTFYSSYVSVITKPSSFQYLVSKFNRGADFEKMSKTISKLSVDELNKSSEIDKLYSIQTSVIVAYREAGKELKYTESGVIVSFVNPNYKSYHDFKIGDIIIQVNGEDIKNSDQFSLKIVNLSCDKDIKFTILRNNKDIQEQKTLTTQKTKFESCKLGLNAYNYYDHFEGNPNFTFKDTKGLGSSAGLMQTLSIYNALVDEDITHGLKIAGTGVIDLNGNILPIAGIKQKVFGAIDNDIDIFFAPNIEDGDGNNLYDLAVNAKGMRNSDIMIYPVKTFSDAVKYLKEYKK